MRLFVTDREKRLWLWTAAVVVAIYASLGLAQSLAGWLRDQALLGTLFALCMWSIAAAIVLQVFRVRAGRYEIGVWLGAAAVYLLVILRMGVIEERTHLIEYSVVALLVVEAFRERGVGHPAIAAFALTTVIGVLDECIQAWLPSRVFDWIDIAFNTLAALMCVTTVQLLGAARRWDARRRSG